MPTVQCLVVCAVLAGLSGAHWYALQTCAWAGMLLDNWRSGPLSEAVSKTFGGEHPCSLCHSIEKTREKQKPAQTTLRFQKLDGVLSVAVAVPEPVFAPVHFFPTVTSGVPFAAPPPTPPPRRTRA